MRARGTIFQRLRIAFVLGRATHFARTGNLEQAVYLLDKAFNSDGIRLDAQSAPPVACVFYARLCWESGKPLEAFSVLRFVVERLDRGECDRPDRDYLYFYCKWLLCLLSNFSDSEAFSTALSIGGSYAQLDQANTSRTIKRYCPIPREDGPKVDRFLELNMPSIS